MTLPEKTGHLPLGAKGSYTMQHRCGRSVSIILCFAAAACSADATRVDVPSAGLTEVSRFAGEPVIARGNSIEWWDALGASGLSQRIDALVAQNPDLAASAFRVLQRELDLGNVRSWRLPVGTAGLNTTTTSAEGISATRETTSTITGSVSASWELDLWRRIAAEGNSAAATLLASVEDREALINSLIAQMIRAYIAAGFDTRQIRATQDVAASRVSTLEIVEQRFAFGVSDTTAGNVASARESLAAARADLPGLELSLIEQLNRMDVLTGAVPRSRVGSSVALPIAPPARRGGAGIPLELLDARPDIRAAAARLTAANANIRVSVAERLPAATLTGRLQSSGETLEELFDINALVASLIADLTATLFDGGRGSRLVAIREAEARALAQDYVATVLGAMEEVENTLAAERLLAIQAARLRDRLNAAREATEIARDRFAAGTGDFLTLLESSRAELSAETAYLQAQERRWNARVDLQLALGGPWLPPPVTAERPEQMARGATR